MSLDIQSKELKGRERWSLVTVVVAQRKLAEIPQTMHVTATDRMLLNFGTKITGLLRRKFNASLFVTTQTTENEMMRNFCTARGRSRMGKRGRLASRFLNWPYDRTRAVSLISAEFIRQPCRFSVTKWEKNMSTSQLSKPPGCPNSWWRSNESHRLVSGFALSNVDQQFPSGIFVWNSFELIST